MTQQPRLSISDVKPEHCRPIRRMRLHPSNRAGFLDQRSSSDANQERYMVANAADYIVYLLEGEPVGHAGVIGDDLQICADPDFKEQGIGALLLQEIIRPISDARAKTLRRSEARQAPFERCCVPVKVVAPLPQTPS